jgi:hypothetical protein
MGLSRDLPTGATETAFSHELSLRHVYFFVNNQPLESHSSCPIAGPMVNGSPEVERVDPSVEKGNLEWKSTSVVEPSLDHIYFFVDQKNQNILLQPCRNEDAGDDAANHTKKQLTSNLRQETGDQSLAAPHKVHIRPLDPITQQFLDEVLPLSETPLLKSGAPPDPAIPLPHAKKSDAGLNPQLKARDHGTINACSVEHFADYQPDSDLSSMNTNSETIASAMDIGTPTVVEIPADAKSVAILKTIKADKIKRAGPTSTFTPRGTAGNFQALCADWGIDTKLPLTFQDAISGLFGQSLLQLLITSSSILQQISNLPVLPDTSNLVALSNGSFTWVSSALLEFQIPENTSIQYGGKAVTILSANIKLDCSKDGTITVLLSANRLGDGHTTWSWSESNVGLFARFVFEQDHLPVTLSHIGKNGKNVDPNAS